MPRLRACDRARLTSILPHLHGVCGVVSSVDSPALTLIFDTPVVYFDREFRWFSEHIRYFQKIDEAAMVVDRG